MSDIDELEALAKGATQGRVEPRFSKAMPADCLDYGIVNLDTGKEICRVWERNDVEFLSAANPAAILKLIGDIRTLQAERDAAYNRGIEDAAKVAKGYALICEHKLKNGSINVTNEEAKYGLEIAGSIEVSIHQQKANTMTNEQRAMETILLEQSKRNVLRPAMIKQSQEQE